jgi:hypothetical protein
VAHRLHIDAIASNRKDGSMNRVRFISMVFALTLASSAAAAEEPAVEDTWWQSEGRDRSAYLEAGFEMTVDDGNTEGSIGDAGHVELTTGYYFSPYLAAELQLAIGRAVNPGVFSETRVESTLGAVGLGFRLGLPIRLSPLVAAHIGYRQVLDRRAELTCGDTCGRRVAMAWDEVPDEQVYADVEAGMQLNLGTFSVSASVELSRPIVIGESVDVMTRRAPGGKEISSTTTTASEVGFNLHAGVRF